MIDIYSIDFFKLKFLKQTGRFYYLNSVTHRPGRLSDAEMIEISEFLQNLPPSQLLGFEFNISFSSIRPILESELLTGYEDPEGNEALKIKIISGFNANVILWQDGAPIVAETEILFTDLILEAVETTGGPGTYSEEWIYAVADKGSGQYGDITATLKANAVV